MSTIVTRAGKGGALTWTEGDANITNLNNDKLEDITGESIGDLSDVDLTGIADGNALVWNNAASTFEVGSAGASSIGDLSDVNNAAPTNGYVLTWNSTAMAYEPADPDAAATITGNITTVNGTADTMTFNPYAGITQGDAVTFQGTDVSSSGLTISTVYYIGMDMGSGSFKIQNNMMVDQDLTEVTSPTNFTFTVTPAAAGTALNDLSDVNITTPMSGQVLTYSSASSEWQAQTPSSGIASVSADSAPSLGGNLNANNNKIQAAILEDYLETIHSLGSTDTPTITVANGNVQSVTISAGLALPAFSDATAGQSVTLLVSGTGSATGTGAYVFAGGAKTLTTSSVVSIFYDGTTYWTSIATDFQA